MKLVEILARELKEWPGEIDAIVQRSTGGIYLYGLSTPISHVPLANDWALAIVTKGEWEAERARIAANQQATQEARDIARTCSMTSEEQELAAIACGKRSKEDKELWDKVALDAFSILIDKEYQNLPEGAMAIDAFNFADAFMAERAERMKG